MDIRTTCVERRRLLAAALIALLTGGCGGHGRVAAPLAQRGRAVFDANCRACHTVTGRDSRVRGGDLAIAPLSTRDIASFVRVMPVHLRPRDVAAVAAYVHATTVEHPR